MRAAPVQGSLQAWTGQPPLFSAVQVNTVCPRVVFYAEVKAENELLQFPRPWDASQFTASDDRVRGGKSQSYLTVLGPPSATAPADPSRPGTFASRAEFSGHLDIATLGGAGFASQRTVDDIPAWDLSGYDTLVLDVDRADGKKYTVTLKNETLPKRPDGREQSSISWEYDFVVKGDRGVDGKTSSAPVVIPFTAFQPTYRGKAKPDAKPLDLKDIKRISFMMRR